MPDIPTLETTNRIILNYDKKMSKYLNETQINFVSLKKKKVVTFVI